jgi:hypothetical protein
MTRPVSRPSGHEREAIVHHRAWSMPGLATCNQYAVLKTTTSMQRYVTCKKCLAKLRARKPRKPKRKGRAKRGK